MTTPNTQAALQGYLDTIGRLYETVPSALAERSGTADIPATPGLEERAQAAVDQSRDLARALASQRTSDSPDVSELADLQLLAAAALDLQLASDLVRRADEGVAPDVAERSASLPGAFAALRPILEADLAQGMAGIIGVVPQRSGGPSNPQAARAALKEAIEGAFVDLRDDAADVGQKAVVGLTQLPVPVVQQAAGVLLAEVMDRIGAGATMLVRKAIALIVQAVDKILEAMGKDAQDEVRAKLGEWIEELRTGTLFASLLDRLGETERLKSEVLELVDAAPNALDVANINAASARVAELSARFAKQKDTILWILKGLAWARAWLMPIVPWGPVGLSAAYATTIGYAAYAFVDRVDAYRLGGPERLDHLPGVRRIVREELGPG